MSPLAWLSMLTLLSADRRAKDCSLRSPLLSRPQLDLGVGDVE